MAEEKALLKETKGTFKFYGKVFNTTSNNFYKSQTVKNGRDMRFLSFGLRISPNENVYISLNGMEQEFVYVSKKGENGKKSETKKVEWSKRNNYGDEWKLIGVNVRLEKDETGKNVENSPMHPYDAIEYIRENLKDDMSVLVAGNIEHSSYKDKNTGEMKKMTKFVPTGIFLTTKEIDFDAPDWKRSAEILQPAIILSNRTDMVDGVKRFYANTGIVQYKDYTEVEFEVSEVIHNEFKKRLRPYTFIHMTGTPKTELNVEVVEEKPEDTWGEASEIGKQKKPTRVYIYINGARGETVDKEIYAQPIIEEWKEFVAQEKAKKAVSANPSNFEKNEVSGDSGSWGVSSSITEEEGAW